ncbi:hypothetical protein LCGC14_2280900 [marine sediment metagenome]|uniref:Uncharacterized protein n=1 Tax=marine sediment metagenome TaxID=412755 RepID=A0A0F9CUP0_9ZZZZ
MAVSLPLIGHYGSPLPILPKLGPPNHLAAGGPRILYAVCVAYAV